MLTPLAWSESGIVGRGVLLDFHSWRLENKVDHDPFKTTSITLDQLKAVAAAQGTDIKFGDILIIRSGELNSALILQPAKSKAISMPTTVSQAPKLPS